MTGGLGKKFVNFGTVAAVVWGVLGSFAANASSSLEPLAGYGGNRIEVLCQSTSGGLCAHTGPRDANTENAVGDLFTLAGTGAPVNSGDGSVALSAGIAHPSATAVDSQGNVVVASPSFHTVRVVCMKAAGLCAGTTDGTRLYAPGEPGGTQAIVPGHIYHLAGVWSSQSTNPNYGYGSGPDCNGTGEGGPANVTCLNQPNGVAVDSADNVLIADTMNNRVRIVCMNVSNDPYCDSQEDSQPGSIHTLAGGGQTLGDGSPAKDSLLNQPISIAIDSNDNVAITEGPHFGVRMICAGDQGLCGNAGDSGLLGNAGAPAVSGNIYTVEGTENREGSFASVGAGLGFDSRDDLLVSDPGNSSVSCFGSGCSLHANGSSDRLVIRDPKSGGLRFLFY